MNEDEIYMSRCLQLACNGKGFVHPNPMVGAVIVSDGKIIGEGFHRQYGHSHAEVNAINSVSDKTLLKKSTLYVSLEPCAHYGKTPPCAKLIADYSIPRVVIATTDPYPAVSGRGIAILESAGINVTIGVLETEARELNKEFFTGQIRKRPYIYLKWAQSIDGYLDRIRTAQNPNPAQISNEFTQILVHKKRAEIAAIMVGTNTVLADNPNLTTRLWYGENPTRIILDREGKIPTNANIFNHEAATILFTENIEREVSMNKIRYIPVKFDANLLKNIFYKLNELKLNSILIEGGTTLLDSIIKEGFWDEAFIEVADMEFGKGVCVPIIKGRLINAFQFNSSKYLHYKPY